MLKLVSKKRSNVEEAELVDQFKGIDPWDLPAFSGCETYLEMGLWVLWASKEKLGVEKIDSRAHSWNLTRCYGS